LSKAKERSAMYHNVSSDNEAQHKKNKLDGPVIYSRWYQYWIEYLLLFDTSSNSRQSKE